MKNYPQQKKNIGKTTGEEGNEIQWEGMKVKLRREEFTYEGRSTNPGSFGTTLVSGPGLGTGGKRVDREVAVNS